MAEEVKELNFATLSEILKSEVRTSHLTKIESDFYPKVNKYFATLKHEIAEMKNQENSEDKIMDLYDEYKRATSIVTNIWRRRTKKIVAMAWEKCNTNSVVNTKSLTVEEKKLYDNLLAVLTDAQLSTFKELSEIHPLTKTGQKKLPVTGESPVEMVDTSQISKSIESKTIVRILEDLQPIAHVNENYHLKKNEIVTLPEKLAELLIKKGKAKKVSE